MHWLEKRGWEIWSLTRQDHVALFAIAHCWQFWKNDVDQGKRAAIGAVASLLDACSEAAWPMARELVACAGNWEDRDMIWPQVVYAFRSRETPFVIGDSKDKRVQRLAYCHVGVPQVER